MGFLESIAWQLSIQDWSWFWSIQVLSRYNCGGVFSYLLESKRSHRYRAGYEMTSNRVCQDHYLRISKSFIDFPTFLYREVREKQETIKNNCFGSEHLKYMDSALRSCSMATHCISVKHPSFPHYKWKTWGLRQWVLHQNKFWLGIWT